MKGAYITCCESIQERSLTWMGWETMWGEQDSNGGNREADTGHNLDGNQEDLKQIRYGMREKERNYR